MSANNQYFTPTDARLAEAAPSKEQLCAQRDREREEEKAREVLRQAAEEEEEEGKKEGGSADVQTVLSHGGESSKGVSFRDKVGALKKRVSGTVMSNDADIAYSKALLSGASRFKALAAADAARAAQQAKFDEGVQEAKAVKGKLGTDSHWADKGCAPMPVFSFS
ncbi:hypothetical protein JCM8547_000547 [Rhodosporidiobolus lusitaniae]